MTGAWLRGSIMAATAFSCPARPGTEIKGALTSSAHMADMRAETPASRRGGRFRVRVRVSLRNCANGRTSSIRCYCWRGSNPKLRVSVQVRVQVRGRVVLCRNVRVRVAPSRPSSTASNLPMPGETCSPPMSICAARRRLDSSVAAIWEPSRCRWGLKLQVRVSYTGVADEHP